MQTLRIFLDIFSLVQKFLVPKSPRGGIPRSRRPRVIEVEAINCMFPVVLIVFRSNLVIQTLSQTLAWTPVVAMPVFSKLAKEPKVIDLTEREPRRKPGVVKVGSSPVCNLCNQKFGNSESMWPGNETGSTNIWVQQLVRRHSKAANVCKYCHNLKRFSFKEISQQEIITAMVENQDLYDKFLDNIQFFVYFSGFWWSIINGSSQSKRYLRNE